MFLNVCVCHIKTAVKVRTTSTLIHRVITMITAVVIVMMKMMLV